MATARSRKVVGSVLAFFVPLGVYYALFLGDNQAFVQNMSRLIPSPQRLSLSTVEDNVTTTAPQANVTQLKKILYWNDFFGNKDYYFGTGQQPFLNAGCPVNACIATYDRDLFKLEELDALIWHPRSDDLSLPPIRFPQTHYVFYLEESPVHLSIDLHRYVNVFNLTMTYRRDADVFAPYGWYEPLQEPLQAKRGSLTNYAQGKTKMVAWFVSNCKASSQREILVTRLQQHISVDIYGDCSELKCPKQKSLECYEMLNSDYRFYLSFENSLCKDYITEKFFQVTGYNVIPVVYGYGQYSEIAPNNSYINILDFASIKALADHLTYLSQNNTAYNEYFRWREEYKLLLSKEQKWCLLCQKLHEEHPASSHDIYKWFKEDKCVEPSNEMFNKLFHS